MLTWSCLWMMALLLQKLVVSFSCNIWNLHAFWLSTLTLLLSVWYLFQVFNLWLYGISMKSLVHFKRRMILVHFVITAFPWFLTTWKALLHWSFWVGFSQPCAVRFFSTLILFENISLCFLSKVFLKEGCCMLLLKWYAGCYHILASVSCHYYYPFFFSRNYEGLAWILI